VEELNTGKNDKIEDRRSQANVHVERVVMWRCNGTINGKRCDYRMTDIEMQAHMFDLGCPRCKSSFADFSLYFEERLCTT